MNGGWRYRLAAVAGTAILTAAAVAIVNNAAVLSLASILPVLSGLPTDQPLGSELIWEILTAVVVFVAAMSPLYKPRPRRILDTIAICQRRVLLGMFVLATIGYFDYTYRLPRLTVLLATSVLLVVLPGWFVWIRRHPKNETIRAIIVGDDINQIRGVAEDTDLPIRGYLAPMSVFDEDADTAEATADGGLTLLGGLSRIEDVFIDYDIDTAFLAFQSADRAEFFGALDACYEHGVAAKIHREHADSVLTSEGAMETFVDVDIEPWDVQDYFVKRAFDVVFSAVGLVCLTPAMLAVALAIKLGDGGAVLYRQERTAAFGETFHVFKFRSMVETAEVETGPTLSEEDDGGVDPRVTRVGRVLRRTHLDEIPQLWSVLWGDMSVVGPRPERPELDEEMDIGSGEWRTRWFVKPGLTGLAQVSGVTGFQPKEKLRYDIEYIRKQSFWFDVKIVLRQLSKVGMDMKETLSGSNQRGR